MADYESVKQKIIQSVFSKRAGEEYVAHLKIWENDNGADKPRYILLSRSPDSQYIHKSRLNPNGSFSVGKTWRVTELHGIEVQAQLELNITFARSYRWQTESQNDQDRFLDSLVNLYRAATGSISGLNLSGFSTGSHQPRQRQRSEGGPGPSTGGEASSIPAQSSRRVASPVPRLQNKTPVDSIRRSDSPLSSSQTRSAVSQRTESPTPVLRSALNGTSALNGSIRAASPAGSYRSNRTTSPSRTRPSSPSRSEAQSSRRRPTNGTARSSESVSGSSSTPTIVIPSSVSSPPSSWTKDGASSSSRAIPAQPLLQSRAISSRSSFDVPPISPTSSQNVVSSPTEMAHVPSMSRQLSARTPSPAPSTSSRRSQRGKTSTPTPEPPLPTRVTPQNSQNRRDPNARISFFDPVNQALLDRLLSTTTGPPPSGSKSGDGAPAASVEVDDEVEDEGDNVQATLVDIEEMLEGYEWLGEGMTLTSLKSSRGPADHIESRLLDELLQLERANIHSFLESDDRISTVMQYLDDAILELDGMDSILSSYKIHLNAVGDDIAYIQSQNRGLQVQTQNQKALLAELEKLLQTVHVDRETLLTLTQESLEKSDSIQKLQEAAAELYKALLAGRDNDMAATMERLDEYRTHNSQFCKRLLDFLTIMFTAQSDLLLRDSSGVIPKGRDSFPEIIGHQDIEAYLGRYCGLMLYLKEMDEGKYSKLCAGYFSATSDLHSKQVKALVKLALNTIKRSPDDDEYQGFSSAPLSSNFTGGLRRAGTIVKSPLDSRKEKAKQSSGNLLPQEALDGVLEQLAPLVYRENRFIADFLQINDAALTFADYMSLDHYFCRQAAEYSGLSTTTVKLIRGAMDLIFGSLSAELKTFIDDALSQDQTQIAGLLASLERNGADAESKGNGFFATIVEKQHQRLKTILDRFIDEQIRDIEQTRLTAKKRSGVVHFVKHFPTFVGRIESQLVGANDLEIRGNIDAAYDRIVQAMFDCLKQMAKMEGEQGEEKGQLNYHVIIIENMHHFIEEVKQSKISAVGTFKKRADSIYHENLSAYVKLVMRRSFAKIIDYFDGVDRLLKTIAPTEVVKNGAYSRSTLKKVVKEYDAKDVRKNIDALFKRVEKHFTDGEGVDAPGNNRPNAVLAGVWKACEEELLRNTDVFMKRIKQCYAETGVSLEYSRADVESAFKKHTVPS